jgi:EAL domain-containing protein (putative c-di-GMP-specific phosphodiesterase class I)/CHASE2 domain-containing sensor protein
MIWPFSRSRRAKSKKARSALRSVVWALIIGACIGAVNAARPLEDIYRGVRNMVRERPADGKIVVVGLDDRSMERLGSNYYYSRGYDARMTEKLLASGAKRVLFDFTFERAIDKTGDLEFAAMLQRNPGKVVLGQLPIRDRATGAIRIMQPLELFRQHGQVGSIHAKVAPFGLSEELYYADKEGDVVVRSLSSIISNVDGAPNSAYRPDWAIDIATIPTYSMIDVLDGKIPATAFAGRDVLFADTTTNSSDVAHVAGKGWFPGVYDHVIGAQTLRERLPLDIGWMPAFLGVMLAVVLLLMAKTKRRAALIIGGTAVVGLAVPLALDSFHITAEFIPAYFAFGLAAYRLANVREVLQARKQNAATLLPNLSALREEPLVATRPIIAMRIRNYAAVGASFTESVEDELINEIVRRLTLPGQASTFYQAEDVLYWLGPALPPEELNEHIAGLIRLTESLFLIRSRKVDIHVAIGVDTDLARPVASRIGRALLAADTAASKHQPYMFNTSDNDEESAWELSLMSELDEAIEGGDIWIAYQPQFDLKADTISGAEALVRWQHPTRGAISPEAFILPAEEHNRIGKLTFHVLEQATLAARQIVLHNPDFRLSVNISATLMEQVNLPGMIVEVLGRTNFPTRNLTLEVTESAPFSEHETVATNLAGIAALGIDLSIDDYGTGNATLEYLRSVPCQEIKIDRRFVTSLLQDNGDMLLVESTIELAHGLGRRVIAEGIEDPETLELLRAIGCDLAQGYYLAKPMRIEALESLLSASRRIKAA